MLNPSEHRKDETPPRTLVWAAAIFSFVGGMAIVPEVMLFLSSGSTVHTIEGIGGAALAATLCVGSIALVYSVIRSDRTRAVRIVATLHSLFPILVACVSLPLLFFEVCHTFCFAAPIVLIGCTIWAAWANRHAMRIFVPVLSNRRRIFDLILIVQILGVLASWAVLGDYFYVLERHGYRIDWP